MSVVVQRNTSIPCEKKSYYTTIENNQEEVEIKIFQGERSVTSECRSLGTFHLLNIPPMMRGLPKIKVNFKIDADGILCIRAVEELSNLEQNIVISGDSTRLSEDEVERMIRNAEQSQIEDQTRLELVKKYQDISNLLEDYSRISLDHVEVYGEIQSLKRDLYQSSTNNYRLDELDKLEKYIKNEISPQIERLYRVSVNSQLDTDLINTNIDELNIFLNSI